MNNWSARHGGHHPSRCFERDVVEQEVTQVEQTVQTSREVIIIRDSCDVDVKTTDTKAAVNLQAALQLAIALVLSVTIADSDRSEAVSQELLQRINVRQTNRQKTVIENSRGVQVTTTDTDISVNIQVLLQVLVALIAKIDVL